LKRHLIIILILGIWLVPLSDVCADTSYHIADYYPINSGNIWFFNRNIFLIGPQAHDFTNYADCKPWYDVITITEQYGFLHVGEDGLLFTGLGLFGRDQFVDLTDTPIVFATADCQVGQVFTTVIPPYKLDPDDDSGLTINSTLADVDTVVAPAGTFHNCLKFNIEIIDGTTSWYKETLWLAKGIGPVKVSRPEEFPLNHEGCFMTCGAFDEDGLVDVRDMPLEAFVSTNGGDVNGDGKIGIEDAVKALQTVSGAR
jgi:hypothetical protein